MKHVLLHYRTVSHALFYYYMYSASAAGGRRDAVRMAGFGGIARHGTLDPLLASAAHEDDPRAMFEFNSILSNSSSVP